MNNQRTTLYRSSLHWNHYRIPSARADWWDYGKNGVYYVTICTKHRASFFGTLQRGQMKLSAIGKLAKQFWLDIPKYALPGVRLEAFEIMPNHIHGIIVLEREEGQEPLRVSADVETLYYKSPQELTQNPPHPHSNHPPARSAFFAKIRPRKGSLSQVLRSFKAVVTKHARQLEVIGTKEAFWQSRFYDRVVRNSSELRRITRHIQNNPQRWKDDDYYIRDTTSVESADKHRDNNSALYLKAGHPPMASRAFKHPTVRQGWTAEARIRGKAGQPALRRIHRWHNAPPLPSLEFN